MKKKGLLISLLAVLAALAGLAVALGTMMKKGTHQLKRDLDFDENIYGEEDDDDPFAYPEIDGEKFEMTETDETEADMPAQADEPEDSEV